MALNLMALPLSRLPSSADSGSLNPSTSRCILVKHKLHQVQISCPISCPPALVIQDMLLMYVAGLVPYIH